MDIRQLRRPIHLILDWDGTLTRKDTLSLVGQVAYHAHGSNSSSQLPPWSDFVDGYTKDYTNHASAYTPKPAQRTTLTQERKWLASLTPIENRSVQRVSSSGLFRGVKASHVDHVAKNALESGDLQMRPHWDALLQGLLTLPEPRTNMPNNKISVLSVNWSARFIRRALVYAASASETGTPSSQTFLCMYTPTMEILANEIEGIDTDRGSDGILSKKDHDGIRTNGDKLAHMPPKCRGRLDDPLESTDKGSDDQYTVVYVGDSATDLEALLAADVGICIRDEPMGGGQRELAETLQRIGVKVLHIAEHGNTRSTSERVVYWASGFEDIAKVLPVL